MENEKDTPRQLLFLEPVNKDSSEEELVKRLIIRLESLGFNIIGNFLVEGNVVGRLRQYNIKSNLNDDLRGIYGGGGGTLLLSFSKSLNIHHNSQHLLDFIAQ